MSEEIRGGLLGILGGVVTALGLPILKRWWERADQRRVDSAQVQIAEIRHTENLMKMLRELIDLREHEIAGLKERIENLEIEREAWRTERVAFETERLELRGRVQELESRLVEAGLEPRP